MLAPFVFTLQVLGTHKLMLVTYEEFEQVSGWFVNENWSLVPNAACL